MIQCSTVIRFLTWQVNRTAAAGKQLANWNKTIQFTLTGEDPFYVTFTDNRMDYNPGRASTADLELVSRSKDFLDVITGKTKFDQGFSNGTYTIHGSITDAVRLMRVAEAAFESHSALTQVLHAALRAFT